MTIEIFDVLVDALLGYVHIYKKTGRERDHMQFWGISTINLAEHTEKNKT